MAFARRGSRTRWSIACWAICGACIAAAQSTPAFDPPRGNVRLVLFGDFNGPYGSLDYPVAVARTVAATAAGYSRLP